jgi:8-oxo-dGTP diphosphatase
MIPGFDRRTVVTAAVIERDGCFLLTRRREGTHLAGYWEFPGGKCEQAETAECCLARELREELDVDASVGEELFRMEYDYPGRRLDLRFFRCSLNGVPRPVQGQEMRWVPRGDLRSLTFPPADTAFLALLTKS